MASRIEKDFLGEKQLPDDAYRDLGVLKPKGAGAIIHACDRLIADGMLDNPKFKQ